MIRVKIREAAKKRRLKNAYQFGQSVGFSDRVALRIWNNDQPPKLKTLDRICNAWRCRLDELIDHKLDKASANGDGLALPQKRTQTKAHKERTIASLSGTKRDR